ncbi:MAG: ATP-binding protein [Gaiellaceae bacterium]
MRSDLPTGTVTFLFTDVEGSTELLRKLGAEGYAQALAEHRRVVREACADEGGVEVDTQGDAFFFAFPSAPGAASAAQAITDALAPSSISLRIGLHTGIPLVTGEGYVGDDVHFAARVAASGHGGQVLLSKSARELVEGLTVSDLGEHRLKDIEGAVSIYQLGDETFPPLETISNTNLPRPASSFVGREREQEEVVRKLQSGTRLLTLTGPGGSGKTRLAVEAAATLVPSYTAGVFWVGLAALREPSLVTETIAQTLGARDGLAVHIGDRAMLLLLDNLEQVIEAAPELSELVQSCPNLALLVTSRELLRVQGEVEYAVPPLAASDAVSLFCERSQLERTAEIAELCSRLDDLPLAVELAAARTRALSPAQILERLSQRLDLLEGGRDAETRQQTLRATIAWSYDLLSQDEQRLFRSLSVFAGGCTLGAAEEVAGADLNTLQSLVEKSLLRFTNARYWMLETVRAYARDKLSEAGGTAQLGDGHSRYFLALVAENDPTFLSARQGELMAWYGAEENNLRVMLDYLADARALDATRAASMLHGYWRARGALAEARDRYKALLMSSSLPGDAQSMLFGLLADLEEVAGDLDAAEAAVEQALALAESAGDTRSRAEALRNAGWIAARRGDADHAVVMARRAVEVAALLDDSTRLHALHDLGGVLLEVGRHEEARSALRETVDEARTSGLTFVETFSLLNLAKLDVVETHYEMAHTTFESVHRHSGAFAHYPLATFACWGVGISSLGLNRRGDASSAFAEMLDLVLSSEQDDRPTLALAVAGIALSAHEKDAEVAARLLGAVAALRRSIGSATTPQDEELERRFEPRLINELGDEAWTGPQALGAAMRLDDAIELARALADRSRPPTDQAASG